MGKNPQGWCRTPLGQDRVEMEVLLDGDIWYQGLPSYKMVWLGLVGLHELLQLGDVPRTPVLQDTE